MDTQYIVYYVVQNRDSSNKLRQVCDDVFKRLTGQMTSLACASQETKKGDDAKPQNHGKENTNIAGVVGGAEVQPVQDVAAGGVAGGIGRAVGPAAVNVLHILPLINQED